MDTFPKGRKHNLIIRDLADELLIYDERRHKAHCLNSTAALIWKHCDGHTSVGDISRQLSRELSVEITDRAVWFALTQFRKEQLLEESIDLPAAVFSQGINRRQAIRALGLTAAVAVPLVSSIVGPTPAQAATCKPSGASCGSPAECCSGLCNAGTCA